MHVMSRQKTAQVFPTYLANSINCITFTVEIFDIMVLHCKLLEFLIKFTNMRGVWSVYAITGCSITFNVHQSAGWLVVMLKPFNHGIVCLVLNDLNLQEN